MTDTVNLGLPCIEGSQAQKHVTHNDALRILDTLVQLAVLDRDLSAPPSSPSEGQRWIVKATGTGAWAGHNNAIAAWQDGAWQFSAPQTGWYAYVADEGTLLMWNGTAWGDFFSTVTSIQNLALLGIGTTADTTNRLSAKLNNTLFVAKTVAEGGDGNLRYKLSKESSSKTLSFLLQDNFSGRAEIGLTGDDDFHFKVSPDGSTWYEALKLIAASGLVSLPLGQLAFPATQNPSSDPNTLDDYEEGTFTPTFTAGTVPTGVTYSTQLGYYTKIGNQVDFYLRIVLTSKGSGGAGNATLAGLPFTANNPGATIAVCGLNIGNVTLVAGYAQAVALVNAGGTSLVIGLNGNNVAIGFTQWSEANNTSRFVVSGQYFV